MSSVPRFAVNMTTFTWMSSTASTSMIMTGDNWEYQTNANKHWGFWISPSSFLLPSQGQFSNHTVQIWYAYCQEYLLASHITLSRSVPKSDEVGGAIPLHSRAAHHSLVSLFPYCTASICSCFITLNPNLKLPEKTSKQHNLSFTIWRQFGLCKSYLLCSVGFARWVFCNLPQETKGRKRLIGESLYKTLPVVHVHGPNFICMLSGTSTTSPIILSTTGSRSASISYCCAQPTFHVHIVWNICDYLLRLPIWWSKLSNCLQCCTAMENSQSPPTWSESNPSECAMIQNHGLHAMFSFVRRHTISTWTAVPSYEEGV